MYMKLFKILIITLSYLLSFFILTELCVNLLAFRYLYPIKNANSYGYLIRKSFAVLVPLNKYPSRFKAQLFLPYEVFRYKFLNQNLALSYNSDTKLYGYTSADKLVIQEKYADAKEFYNGFAIVGIERNGKILYGTIDKKNNWIIKPKYSHICSLSKFYTRACLDNDHCGIINIFGDEITAMVYNAKKINYKDKDFAKYFCEIHGSKNIYHNYCF